MAIKPATFVFLAYIYIKKGISSQFWSQQLQDDANVTDQRLATLR